ncbi:DUF6166 domain-containing protein [Spirosoma sordidisoli]|uniref:Uncharacterized protein n=1 Tax=Spirosoma sordidisoli TaxID=2502893 RepID=A0A4V1RVC8_9BACT|nr:DUF6166 domain-containing protein [Spirosoma sordidisoli]RYC66318.1 hypothetical protein EQG79_30040 [Spirosoma sordidisoli]
MKKHVLKADFDPARQSWREAVITLNGARLSPERSQQFKNHSPDGFAWGYGGSGPAQLALAVLIDLLPTALALQNYQYFKMWIIARLHMEEPFEVHFSMTPQGEVEHVSGLPPFHI